jgi:hypothetical protein
MAFVTATIGSIVVGWTAAFGRENGRELGELRLARFAPDLTFEACMGSGGIGGKGT